MLHRFPGAAVPFALCVEAAFGAAVKVTKSGQGIYAKADETKKAATLPAGTVMEVRNASSAPQGWVQVAVPSCVDLWIFADSVNNGVVTVTTGRIRSSTGPTAPEVARLPRGATVVVRGRGGENGDWYKIAPPSSATMWVKADSVAPTSEAPARVEETSVVADSSQNPTPAILPPIIPTIPTPVATSTPPAPTQPTPPAQPAIPETPVAATPTPPPAPVVPTPVVTVPAPTPPAQSTPPAPPAPVATTTPSAPAPIVPDWQPS